MEKEFVRVRSMRDVIVSAAMTVIGIVLIVLPTSVSVNIFGTCLAVPGVLMLLFYKTDYRDTETGLRFRRVIKYYPASRKAEIMAALKSDLSKVAWNEKGTADGLMLDIYVGHGCNKVFIRVSEFIPYNYEPCSDWFEYDVAHVAQMIAK